MLQGGRGPSRSEVQDRLARGGRGRERAPQGLQGECPGRRQSTKARRLVRGTPSEARGVGGVTRGVQQGQRSGHGGQSTWSLAHPRRALLFAWLEMGSQWKVLSRGTDVP